MGEYGDVFMRNNPNNPAVQSRTKAQNRANVLQLKLIGQSHPTGLTANLLRLFEPRLPLEYKPPPEKRKCPPYTGMAQLVNNFAEPGDSEYAPPVPKAETPGERRARIHKIRIESGAAIAAEELKNYDPGADPNVSGDPYKTLFVSRLNYETAESKIRREFEAYGPIKRVRLVTDTTTNKPKGYAFIEYMHTRDMKTAYKQADGRKVDGRRVLVDVERGRTVPNWRPRRLGGGLGTTRVTGEDSARRAPGREQPQASAPRIEDRVREDRHVEREREKSRDRGGKERERSRELSHDERSRDRDHHRDERHHRDRHHDRDRNRDRGRDRHRDRQRGHDHRRDHGERRNREREYEAGEVDDDHGRSSRDREPPSESRHERDHHRRHAGSADADHGDDFRENDHRPVKHGNHGGGGKYGHHGGDHDDDDAGDGYKRATADSHDGDDFDDERARDSGRQGRSVSHDYYSH